MLKPNKLPKITKSKSRKGRGRASGKGKTAGRGTKGQKARAGYNIPIGFEGGQTPIKKRLPKLGGFKSKRKGKTITFNLDRINKYYKSGQTVSPKSLAKKGLIKISDKVEVKILGRGKLSKKLKFKNVGFSQSAKKKVNKK